MWERIFFLLIFGLHAVQKTLPRTLYSSLVALRLIHLSPTLNLSQLAQTAVAFIVFFIFPPCPPKSRLISGRRRAVLIVKKDIIQSNLITMKYVCQSGIIIKYIAKKWAELVFRPRIEIVFTSAIFRRRGIPRWSSLVHSCLFLGRRHNRWGVLQRAGLLLHSGAREVPWPCFALYVLLVFFLVCACQPSPMIFFRHCFTSFAIYLSESVGTAILGK